MDKSKQFHLWYFIGAVLAVMLLQDLLTVWSQTEAISYSKFEGLLRDHKIDNVVVTETLIRGEMKDGSGKVFVTARVDPDMARQLEASGVSYSGGTDNTLLRSILSWVLPAVAFFGLWMLVIRRMAEKGLGSGFMTIGQNKAKVYVETDTKVTFADVAGVDEAKAELVEIVNFLKDPRRYGRLGARIPKGILLVGPPGTGKTLLARAVAGEAGVPFFSISGSEFVEMFVGVGAARVRDLFAQARTKAPAIIFIDELDALGRARGIHPLSGGHDEKEQTLNQLLAELDGFDPSVGLVLLAATNRPEILDPALLRAGRFDRQVLVDRPDKTGRIQILQVHLKKAKLAPGIDPERLAALTAGFSGADLANLVNEAALLATRRNATAVEEEDFVAAIERMVAGLEKRNRLLNPHERRVVAYHESGHALVALTLPGTDTVQKISIIPRGIGALGYTIQRPTEDRYLMTKSELENRMAVLLAGRAAEMLAFNELSTGAADDLVKATDVARSIATRFGMTDQIGQVALDEMPRSYLGVEEPAWMMEKRYSEETAREIDLVVKATVDCAFQQASAILRERRAVLERMAALLLEKETLTEPEIKALLKMPDPGNPAPSAVHHATVTPSDVP